MMIRMLTLSQIPEALTMANYLFDKEMAPFVSPACTASFHAFASDQMIQSMMQTGKIHVWGAFDEENRLAGVSAMNDPYHVSILCVAEQYRGQGISRALLDAMAQFGAVQGHPHPLTINALDPAIPYLQHVGFVASGQKTTMMDVSYTPMCKGQVQPVMYPNTAPARVSGPGMPGWLKVLIGFICVLAFAIFVYAISMIVSKSAGLTAGNGASDFEEYLEQFDRDNDDDAVPDTGDEENTGIEQIPVYEQKDLSYEIKDKAFSEEEQTGKYVIRLLVKYPQLEGLGDNQDQINELIRNFALETEKSIYENPDKAQKEKALELDQVYVYNDVTYKATYVTDDFISIVFNDVSLLGDSTEQGVVQIRTLNISLTDAKVYSPEEVFDIGNADFQKAWEASVTSEAGDVLGKALPAFSSDLDVSILSGKEADYPPAYFVDKDGVEIGFSILNQEKQGGWVTGPISSDKIVTYKTDSEFWNLVTW